MSEKRTASAQVRFNPTELAKLDALTASLGKDRSNTIRHLIEQAHDRLKGQTFNGEFVPVGSVQGFVVRERGEHE